VVKKIILKAYLIGILFFLIRNFTFIIHHFNLFLLCDLLLSLCVLGGEKYNPPILAKTVQNYLFNRLKSIFIVFNLLKSIGGKNLKAFRILILRLIAQ